MVTALLDTSILIDILRQNPTAQNWLEQREGRLGITPVVWLEVLQGATNRAKQKDALALLKRFERIEVTAADYDWAIEQVIRFRLSHNVGGVDCLIASASFRLQLPLYTINLKHFAP
jgi:predicted nucleic acid-binding protein